MLYAPRADATAHLGTTRRQRRAAAPAQTGEPMKKCKKCLLPAAVPGADIDRHGVCRPCREYSPASASLEDAERSRREQDLHAALEASRGVGQYDCLVPFSGGKPSGKPVDVLSGIVNEDGKALGRPVGVSIDKRGGLLVADDVGDTVWRVSAQTGGTSSR